MEPISEILKTLANNTKKVLWVLGLHAFAFILLLIFLDFILGGLVFYRYVFLAEQEEPKITENIIKFDQKTYLSVLEEINKREQN